MKSLIPITASLFALSVAACGNASAEARSRSTAARDARGRVWGRQARSRRSGSAAYQRSRAREDEQAPHEHVHRRQLLHSRSATFDLFRAERAAHAEFRARQQTANLRGCR